MLKVLPRIILATALAGAACPIAWGQLPPTNMGKYVHQPGDNQYESQAQHERHAPAPSAAPQQAVRQQMVSNTVVYHPVPPPHRPDYSVMPIVCDEPIRPTGFPPLPDSLDFPNLGTMASGFGTPSGYSAIRARAGGGSAGGGSAGGGDNSQPQLTGVHQHYNHYDPTAFIPKEQKSSQYKCLPANMPSKNVAVDSYGADNPAASAGGAGDAGAPKFNSPAAKQLSKMGRAPGLKKDEMAGDSPPEALMVNQSVHQDLSLPEDDQASGQPQQKKTNIFKQQMGQTLMRMPYSVLGPATSMPQQMEQRMMHF